MSTRSGNEPLRRAATSVGVALCGLFLCFAGGCGEKSVPTSLFLTIETSAAAAPPDELRISLYGERGTLFLDQRLPAAGALMPPGPGKLGTVTIYVPATERAVRLDVRGLSAGTVRLRGVKTVEASRDRQKAVTIVLGEAIVSDGDGDLVPDPIDNCLHTANPDQADRDGDGVGDACAPTDGSAADGGGGDTRADGAPDVRTDAVMDAAEEAGAPDAPADVRGDAGADAPGEAGSADAPADAPADVRSDGGADVPADAAATDAATDTPADIAVDTTVESGGTNDAMTDVGRDTTPEAAPDVMVGGLLGIAAIAERATVDLAAEGTLDWAHWGESNPQSFDHKTTGGGKISNLAETPDGRYAAYAVSYVWSGGTPSATGNTQTGVYSTGSNAVLSITVAADNTTRKLRLYVGANDVNARLTAHLSDGAAPDATFNATGRNIYEAPLEITFRAGAANQTLTLTWVPTSTAFGGTISIKAATLF